ncbi:MAG: pyruvate formate lyase family protein [Lachnospiraceae bacterium]
MVYKYDGREYYGIIGRAEMGVQGKLCALANSGYFNLAKTLEIALHSGFDPKTGILIAKKENV